MIKEIEVKIPDHYPKGGIKLVSGDELREHYQEIKKTVPPWFVTCPWVEIAGVWYAILPLGGKDD